MPSELLLNISFKSFFHACRASSLVLHTDKPDAAPHLPRGAPHGPRMPPAPAASLPLLLLVTEPSWNRDQNSYFIKYIRSVVNPDDTAESAVFPCAVDAKSPRSHSSSY